ncbi:hypothetical protein [Xenorhabdus bovienii]|uniref:hypothetical protein n=1 Tax=Xenorhabdus bovienii TaxID=40576 RepID=UPI0023B2F04A|nr:hypothetical protein [Xenorhabdus bovienii]MDE9463467.1 hypothetical protein [Xenorhabdus bovienii]MDE9471236.1 hypothetical protein [Xenorhabdus bovienii]
MSYTYDSPGIWAADLTVTYGDVFLVKQENSNLTTGSYYLALYDGPIIAYPKSGQSDANWKYLPANLAPWGDVNNVQLSTEMGDTATIFANGLQMARVYVYFTQGEKSGDMTVDSLTALAYQNTTLIDYNTGTPLTRVDSIDSEHPVPSDGWYFCTTPNDFVTSNANRGNNDKDVPAVLLTFYVACQSRTQAAKRIGASIQPTGAPDPVMDSAYSSNGFHSPVSITANAPPYTRAVGSVVSEATTVAQWVSVDPSKQPHTGQGSDDGSDYAKGPNYKNLWRQNNFIIRPMQSNGDPVKIKSVSLTDSAGREVKFNSSGYHIYSDSTCDGFNTQCYIFNLDAKNDTPVTLMGNIDITLTSVSWTEAICITWLTQYFPMNKWDSDETKPVSVKMLDVDGNPYYFTPTLPHKKTYREILGIVNNASANPSLLISWGNKIAEVSPNYPSPPNKKPFFYIRDVTQGKYIHRSKDNFYLDAKKDNENGQWFFSYASYPGGYNLLCQKNWDISPATVNKDTPNTAYGDINIWTGKKAYHDGMCSYLFVTPNPIWNPSGNNKDSNQLHLLCNVNGYPGWLRFNDTSPPHMYFSNEYPNTKIFALVPCD